MSPEVADAFGTAIIRFMTERRWTEADLAHLPRENRYEIIDGRLLVTPPASETHEDWCDWARFLLHSAAPSGWRVKSNIGLRYPGHNLIPDLVALSPNTPRAESDYNPVVPALVVEVESPSTRAVDRVDKLEAYAAAGIGTYWRIERTGIVNIYRLTDDGYGEPLVLKPGESAELDHPYPVTVTVPAQT
jgi:Uma2 family endonuclease